jgi:hypothetical protein
MLWQIISKLKVCKACVKFGAAYGAFCGAVVGTLAVPLVGTLVGALIGTLFGVACGTVVGIAGSLLGERLGWCVAGLIGGLTPLLVLCDGLHLSDMREAGFANLAVITAPIGGLLGLVLSRALRSGRSVVPGVQKLAAVIHDATPRRVLTLHEQPAEVIPSPAPEGRGDEVTSLF